MIMRASFSSASADEPGARLVVDERGARLEAGGVGLGQRLVEHGGRLLAQRLLEVADLAAAALDRVAEREHQLAAEVAREPQRLAARGAGAPGVPS